MKRSRGRISRKSRALGRKVKERKATAMDIVREININDRVQIVPYVRYEDFPHMRYANRIGRVIEKRGNSYVVEIKDGGKIKKIITSPVHLKVIE